MKALLALAFAAVSCAALADDCCSAKKPSASEEEFMKVAQEMAMKAEGKMACCKSTAEKAVAKGDEGCCNAPAEPKPFKVFVAGKGYQFFGCKDSAAQGRKDLVAKGVKVGAVQKTLKV
jgi:hypothetical protein